MSLFKVKKWSFPFIMSLACAFGAWAQTPVAPVLSSPTNAAVGQAAALTLSWGTVDTATSYTVQVSTSSTFAVLTVNASGLTTASYAAAGLTIGIEYYWQVSATSAADSTSPWSAIWSFSTLAVPAAPALTAPANAAVNQATSLTLTWNTAARATAYEAQVSTVSTFATMFYDVTGLTGSPLPVSGMSVGTMYYWHVDGSNTSGTGAWSTLRSFTTAFTAPTLSSPTNGDTGLATPLTLMWGTVASAISYSVQVSTGSGFTSLAFSSAGLTVDSSSVAALPTGTTYYWRANATNGTVASAWTTAWSFAIGGVALAAPVLSSPTNTSTAVLAPLTLQWGTVAGAATYSVEVSTGSAFAVFTVNQSTLTAASYAVTSLAAGTTYYWMANATATGSLSPWSTIWHFTTLAVPATPTLAAPANTAVNQATSLTLSWNAAARATSYEAEVSTGSTFAATVFDQAGLTGSPAAVSGLTPGTVYYWEVNASDAAGTSAWSALRSFTTGITAPVLTLPSNGVTDLGQSVVFSWGSVAGGTSYTLQVSTSLTFATTVMNMAGIAAATTTVSTFVNKTIYFWRVEAVGAAVTSPWSTVQDFEIDFTGVHSVIASASKIPTFEIRAGVISYSLKQAGRVEMAVFDLRGRSIFAFSRMQSEGNYSIELANRSVAPGKYYVWFKSGTFEKRTAMEYFGKH